MAEAATQQQTETEPTASLADILGEEFDRVSQTEERPDPEPKQEAAEEEPEEQEAEAEGEEEAEAAGEEADAGEEGEEQETTEPEPVEAPHHWSQADREAFDALPDEAKPLYLEKVKSLESGYNEKFQKVADWERERDTLDEIFKPLDSQLALQGIDRNGAIKRLVAAQQFLQERPVEAIQWLAEQYGVDLNQSQADRAAAEEDMDPQVLALQRQVQNLTSTLQQQQVTAQEQSRAALERQIQEFSTATDPEGQLKHPHFDKVRLRMGALVQTEQAKDLEDAYQQAVWADPDLRPSLLESEKAKVTGAQKEKIAKAKKASRNPKSRSAPKSDQFKPAKSHKAELERVFDEVMATQN